MKKAINKNAAEIILTSYDLEEIFNILQSLHSQKANENVVRTYRDANGTLLQAFLMRLKDKSFLTLCVDNLRKCQDPKNPAPIIKIIGALSHYTDIDHVVNGHTALSWLFSNIVSLDPKSTSWAFLSNLALPLINNAWKEKLLVLDNDQINPFIQAGTMYQTVQQHVATRKKAFNDKADIFDQCYEYFKRQWLLIMQLMARIHGDMEKPIKKDSGYTLLHFACECGNPDLVNCYIKEGADISAKYFKKIGSNISIETPLSLLAKNFEIFDKPDYTLAIFKFLITQKEIDKTEALYWAAQRLDCHDTETIGILIQLLKEGANPCVRTRKIDKELMRNIINVLIRTASEANPIFIDDNKATLLHYALFYNLVEEAKQILTIYQDMKISLTDIDETRDGKSLLHFACEESLDMAIWLLNELQEYDYKADQSGKTPLIVFLSNADNHKAKDFNKNESFKKLLALECDYAMNTNTAYWRAVKYLSQTTQFETYLKSLSNSLPMRAEVVPLVLTEIGHLSPQYAIACMNVLHPMLVTWPDDVKVTLLNIMGSFKQLNSKDKSDCFSNLRQYGQSRSMFNFDVKQYGINSDDFLYCLFTDILSNENTPVVLEKLRELKNRGYSFAVVNDEGDTLLHYAVRQKKMTAPILKELISCGVPYNAINNDNKTPLMLAMELQETDSAYGLTEKILNQLIIKAENNNQVRDEFQKRFELKMNAIQTDAYNSFAKRIENLVEKRKEEINRIMIQQRDRLIKFYEAHNAIPHQDKSADKAVDESLNVVCKKASNELDALWLNCQASFKASMMTESTKSQESFLKKASIEKIDNEQGNFNTLLQSTMNSAVEQFAQIQENTINASDFDKKISDVVEEAKASLVAIIDKQIKAANKRIQNEKEEMLQRKKVAINQISKTAAEKKSASLVVFEKQLIKKQIQVLKNTILSDIHNHNQYKIWIKKFEESRSKYFKKLEKKIRKMIDLHERCGHVANELSENLHGILQSFNEKFDSHKNNIDTMIEGIIASKTRALQSLIENSEDFLNTHAYSIFEKYISHEMAEINQSAINDIEAGILTDPIRCFNERFDELIKSKQAECENHIEELIKVCPPVWNKKDFDKYLATEFNSTGKNDTANFEDIYKKTKKALKAASVEFMVSASQKKNEDSETFSKLKEVSSNKIQMLEAENMRLKTENARLSNDQQAMRSHISLLEKRMAYLNESLASRMDSINRLQIMITELHSRNTQLTKQVQVAQSSALLVNKPPVNPIAPAGASSTKTISIQSADPDLRINKLNETITELRGIIEGKNIIIKDLERTIETNRESKRVKDLQKKLTNLKQEHASKEKDMVMQFNTLMAEVEKLSRYNAEQEEKENQLNKSEDYLSQKHNSLTSWYLVLSGVAEQLYDYHTDLHAYHLALIGFQSYSSASPLEGSVITETSNNNNKETLPLTGPVPPTFLETPSHLTKHLLANFSILAQQPIATDIESNKKSALQLSQFRDKLSRRYDYISKNPDEYYTAADVIREYKEFFNALPFTTMTYITLHEGKLFESLTSIPLESLKTFMSTLIDRINQPDMGIYTYPIIGSIQVYDSQDIELNSNIIALLKLLASNNTSIDDGESLKVLVEENQASIQQIARRIKYINEQAWQSSSADRIKDVYTDLMYVFIALNVDLKAVFADMTMDKTPVNGNKTR